MSTLHFGWANLPCPMEGFEVADGDDGLAYVYGQDAAARTRVSRIVNALQGTSELTALRQQVADLRAALKEVMESTGSSENLSRNATSAEVDAAIDREREAWNRAADILAATQEVQP